MNVNLFVNPKHVVAVSPVQRAQGGAAWFFDVYFTVESHLPQHSLAFDHKSEAELAQAALVKTLKEHNHEADHAPGRHGRGRDKRRGLLGFLAR